MVQTPFLLWIPIHIYLRFQTIPLQSLLSNTSIMWLWSFIPFISMIHLYSTFIHFMWHTLCFEPNTLSFVLHLALPCELIDVWIIPKHLILLVFGLPYYDIHASSCTGKSLFYSWIHIFTPFWSSKQHYILVQIIPWSYFFSSLTTSSMNYEALSSSLHHEDT